MITIGLSTICPKNTAIINGVQHPFVIKNSLENELVIETSKVDEFNLHVILPTDKESLVIEHINLNEISPEQESLIESLMKVLDK